MKITKSNLAQLVQEELSNIMMEGFGLVGALSAVKDAEDKGIADAQEDFARIQAGGKVLQIDTTEETQEEEDAYNKGWQNEMDRLKQSAADRKLNRPPEPETPEDREAAQDEYDFESHFSESRKIAKSQLAQIVQEELAAVTAEGYKANQRDDMSSHAKELTKNRKKGYSPQAAVTAVEISKANLSEIIREELSGVLGMDAQYDRHQLAARVRDLLDEYTGEDLEAAMDTLNAVQAMLSAEMAEYDEMDLNEAKLNEVSQNRAMQMAASCALSYLQGAGFRVDKPSLQRALMGSILQNKKAS